MTSEKYKDHLFLRGRCSGSSVFMRGEVAYAVVFVNETRSVWNPEATEHAKKIINAAFSEMEKQAKAYKTKLRFRPHYLTVSIDCAVSREKGNNFEDALLKALNISNLADYVSKLKQRLRTDEGAVMFCINKNDRSYARRDTDEGKFSYGERAVCFFDFTDEDRENIHTVCHETAHEFGANDYYYPDVVKKAAIKNFKESIMMSDLTFDSLTAYLIGWTDELDSAAVGFLEDTKMVTKEYLEKEHEKNTFTGIGEETGDFYTYRGSLEFGMFQGHGVFSRKEGSRTESMWEKNRRNRYYVELKKLLKTAAAYTNRKEHGVQALFHSDGTVQCAEYQNDVQDGIRFVRQANGILCCGIMNDLGHCGFGQIRYLNGDIYSGEIANASPNGRGIYMYRNGASFAGTFKDGRFEGEGVYTDRKGKSRTGEWKNGNRKLFPHRTATERTAG